MGGTNQVHEEVSLGKYVFKIRAMSNINEKDKMAETPTMRAKKRVMDELPPKEGEPYKILSPGGTVTLGSPQEAQDTYCL